MAIGEDRRVTLVGFAVALSVLAALLWIVGFDDVRETIVRADFAAFALALAAAIGWLVAWGLALWVVLRTLGISLPAREAVLVLAAAQFANNVTPFGQAGGEPFSALLISRTTGAEYETGLAAIASVDALNFVPSIAFAAVGVGYYAAAFTLGPRLEHAATVVVGLAVVAPAVAYTCWRHRGRVERAVVQVLCSLLGGIGRVLPRWSSPAEATIRARVRGFFEGIGRVSADRGRLALALGGSALGWLGIAASLWLSLYAIGHPVPAAVVLVAVPVGAMAGVAPLPGGLGGTEAVLVALLVPTAGVSPTTASAAVLLHRAATYWLPVVLGSGAAAVLGARRH